MPASACCGCCGRHWRISRPAWPLSELQDTPSGSLRISVPKPAAGFVMTALAQFLPAYPDIAVEVVSDDSFTDIVAGRFDAGVRLGESIDQDMIAVRISPDISMAVVGSPSYFAQRPRPETPHDLAAHTCINYRSGHAGGLYAWEFEREGRELSVRVRAASSRTTRTCRSMPP